MARLVRQRRWSAFGDAAWVSAGQRRGHYIPGTRSYLVKCGQRIVGTALAMQTTPQSQVMACFDVVVPGAQPVGCQHFTSHKQARDWLRSKARLVEC